MEVFIKKYFWVVPAITVVICSSLIAKAVNYYIEGNYLVDSDKPAKIPASITPAAKSSSKSKSKDGEPLAKRNMFCSTCQPPEADPDDEVASDGSSVPLTSLPLELVATSVSTVPENSFATIRNSSTNRQGAYGMDSEIPGAGKVLAIKGKYVDFQNTSARRRERVSLLSKAAPKPRAPSQPTTPAKTGTGSKRDELMSMVDEGVNKVDDTTWEIDRDLVNKVTENPALVARGARVVPSIKNGKTTGIKLYAIRPSSVFAKIGLMNGDTVHSINNFELNSLQKGLEIYTKVREANNLTVSLTRRGKPMTMTYRIK